MARDNGHGASCAYCKRVLVGSPSRSPRMATRDHVEPKCRGGQRVVWACFTCNVMKGSMWPDEWQAFMEASPEWWLDGPRPFGRKSPRRAPRPKTPVNFAASPEDVRALARRIVVREAYV